ncbi:acyl-CoA dehydrogenase family protein [Mycobacterium vicinigordonae]|uniref:Acyl-CoA dehydrogenase family protein n=1 Tax=Mycobacterium vicinigordonae TaxID=1719132 RepID=A0A7D6I661_9MYCO|nr:acyl-CoA dehydrogenase family protein [Mycobacterium vicinigordonae]QLL07878.1 acyl-CoA dehydrogenase family protein [Mycobacterium vicinigordonae]
MPPFALSLEQQDFMRETRRVAVELLPVVAAGRSGRINRELLRAVAEKGFLAQLFLTSGPSKVQAFDVCLMREALASVSTEIETAVALQGLGSFPFLQWGSPTALRNWRSRVLDGTAVAAFALNEPGAGSDAASLALAAQSDGSGWRLHGEKTWISNAPDADVYTVFARTVPGRRASGITAFVVAGDSPGLTGERLDMLSPHPLGRLTFDGVRVGAQDVIGEVDDGFRVAMRTLDLFRPSVGAFAVGMAQAALDIAVDHTTTRSAFGGVLADLQAVAHKLADMASRIESSRLLVYSAASAYDAGVDRAEVTYRAAIAKLEATEAAQFVVDAAVQLLGARALQSGHRLEHLYRDVRAPRIYEGASEIQRTIISRYLTHQLSREIR